MRPDAEGRRRVGRAVQAQIARLDMSLSEVLQAASTTNKTLQGLIEGTSWPQLKTQARIERAIDWPEGEIERQAAKPLTLSDPTTLSRGGIQMLDYEQLFERWSRIAAEALQFELEYAGRRRIQVGAARDELWDTFFMAGQVKDGHPWTPPWREVDGEDARAMSRDIDLAVLDAEGEAHDDLTRRRKLTGGHQVRPDELAASSGEPEKLKDQSEKPGPPVTDWDPDEEAP